MIAQVTVNEREIGYSPLPLTVTQDAIAFDGFGLQNSAIRTTLIDSDNLGRVDLASFDFPTDDGGGILSKYFRGRQIRLRIAVTAATPEALNSSIDEIKRSLRKTEGNLDVTVNGEIRRIRATLTALNFDRKHYNVTFVTGDCTFTAAEAFFRAANDQSWLFQSRGTDFWEEIGHAGSADTDPKFYYVFSAGTSATQLALTCRNRTVTVARTFAPGDVLVIDCDAKAVTHNGAAVDYSGMFPTFQPGSNPFHTVIAGTAVVDLTAIAAKNYL